MKCICLSWLAILAIIAGCASDDAPDDSPDCTALLPAVVDSVVVGSSPPTDNPEDIVVWREGDDVELIYGFQGSLMLVVEVVARGSGLTEDLNYSDTILSPGYLPFDLTISMEGVGLVVQRNYPSNPVFHAEDGSWYRETLLFTPQPRRRSRTGRRAADARGAR